LADLGCPEEDGSADAAGALAVTAGAVAAGSSAVNCCPSARDAVPAAASNTAKHTAARRLVLPALCRSTINFKLFAKIILIEQEQRRGRATARLLNDMHTPENACRIAFVLWISRGKGRALHVIRLSMAFQSIDV
jgi:hypothetical protein